MNNNSKEVSGNAGCQLQTGVFFHLHYSVGDMDISKFQFQF